MNKDELPNESSGWSEASQMLSAFNNNPCKLIKSGLTDSGLLAPAVAKKTGDNLSNDRPKIRPSQPGIGVHRSTRHDSRWTVADFALQLQVPVSSRSSGSKADRTLAKHVNRVKLSNQRAYPAAFFASQRNRRHPYVFSKLTKPRELAGLAGAVP